MSRPIDIEEARHYIRLDDRDLERVQAMGPTLAPAFPAIARRFYERVRENPSAHAVLRDEQQVLRLTQSLVTWMQRVFTGPYDANFYEQTRKIGHRHVQVGLSNRYVHLAMSVLRQGLLSQMDKAGLTDLRDRAALHRVLDLELLIMDEAFYAHLIERIQSAEAEARRQLGADLEKAELRYVNAVELAPVAVVGLNRDGRIILFNREAERLTGFERDELVGERFAERFVESSSSEAWKKATSPPEEVGAPISARAPARTQRATEISLVHRSGRIRETEWHFALMPAEQVDDVTLFAIGDDVTDARAIRSKLNQAEKLATVGTLAAGLAHEIRNPLNGALLHVTFLERGFRKLKIEDEDTQEALSIVRSEIVRLSNLVTEFLDFARPRPLEKKAESLTSLCKRAVMLVQPNADAHDVIVQSELPETDLLAPMDSEKLEQVLLNLMQNAVEAIAHGGGEGPSAERRIVIRLRRLPHRAAIDIEDSGPGLSAGKDLIFDPFFSTKASGTGLGLAIAHRIVTDHEGALTVESVPGRTVFCLELPLARAADAGVESATGGESNE